MAQKAEPTGVFYRSLPVTTKAVDLKERTVRVVASTATIDGHGEIVEQDWDLSRFDRNPVYLWNHNRFAEGPNALPLGHVKDYGVAAAGTDQARLEATLVHATAAANPMADNVLNSFNEQSLRMVSVGFRPGDIRYEQRDGKEVAVLSKNMLLELSATPIGSNPDALAEQKAFETAYIERMTGRKPSSDEPTPETDSPSQQCGAEPEEDNMDTKELQAALDEARSQLGAANTEKAALEAQNQKLADERDKALEKATKLEQKLVEQEIDALVGNKFSAAERDAQVELRMSNPELYERLLSQRTGLDLLGRMIPDEPPTEKATAADDEKPGQAMANAVTSAAYGG